MHVPSFEFCIQCKALSTEGYFSLLDSRLKIGVCEGQPRSVVADHMGRADYHGACINQAARFMDVAAHGGQVACEKSLAMRAFTVELQTGPLATAALAATINQSQPVQQHVIFPAQRASVSLFKLPDLRQQQGGTLSVVENVAASQAGLEPGGPPLKVSETGDAAPLAVGEGARGSLKVPLSVKIEVDKAASQGGVVGPVTVHTSVVSGGELEDSVRSRDLLLYDNLEVEGVTLAKA
ncbi:hypothetical protein CEUSTIGMA_g14052.t1, partial [Chlamydomonas eustigma]